MWRLARWTRSARGNNAATACFKAWKGDKRVTARSSVSSRHIGASVDHKDAEIRAQFRERRPGRFAFTWLARRPAGTGSIRELRFFLLDVLLGGVRFPRIRRLHGSLWLT